MSDKLDPAHVPVDLHPLIPLAEQFGIEDDDRRRAAIGELTPELAQQLREIVAKHESDFDDWLAGPEADTEQSDEYVAFTYLRIAAEGG